jgi:Protein of unknown function (DUF1553)/Protein of unknown function (DUF1549)/Planctomycete cytochrome C
MAIGCFLNVQIAVASDESSDQRPAPSLIILTPKDRENEKFFESKVRPLLVARCAKCHNEKVHKGNLRLDSREHMLIGGDSGPAIFPGKPDESLLIEVIRHESLEMPPDGKLADSEIDAIVEWIAEGATWTALPSLAGDAHISKRGKITAEDRAYWAFQKVTRPVPPDVPHTKEHRVHNPIDQFIGSLLTTEGLCASPEASPATLIRRAYFDLLGVPPTSLEMASAEATFLEDSNTNAFSQLVEQLLTDKRYGERWARFWLDLSRFAESDGFRQDAFRPSAWRYRDYVIDSFNNDKPYDLFILEQLAGDEINPESSESIIATGFLRQGPYEYNQIDVPSQLANILNEVTDVTADVFLGMGMSCSRCHDHKFDPLLQRDYFRLQAFFAPMIWVDDTPVCSVAEKNAHRDSMAAWQAKASGILNKIALLEDPLRHVTVGQGIARFPSDIQSLIRKSASERTPLEEQLVGIAVRQILFKPEQLDKETRTQYDALHKELASIDGSRPVPLSTALTVRDVGPVSPATTIPGNRSQELLSPGFPEVLVPESTHSTFISDAQTSSTTTGRRTALARWIASAENPLTARVMVNRLWQCHFGRGLVASSSDFGRLGDRPSHPELLDWLASELVDSGWSLKHINRLIVTSATYRQLSIGTATIAGIEKDPLNKFISRQNCRRLDAEQVRDAAFTVSGELDRSMYGPSVPATQLRRSLYTSVIRNTRDPLVEVFDGADPYLSTAERNTTTTANQSLFMINGEWMLARAAALAERIERKELPDDLSRAQETLRAVTSRTPTDAETRLALKFLLSQREKLGTNPLVAASLSTAPMPQREGKAAVLDPTKPLQFPYLSDHNDLPSLDFTIEASVVLRSIFQDASVRTIVSQWDGDPHHPGWSFGVTGEQSRFAPRSLILELSGDATDPKSGRGSYEVISSGIHLELMRPYSIAASVQFGSSGTPSVTFFVQDLSDNDAAVIVKRVEHSFVCGYDSQAKLFLGGRDSSTPTPQAKGSWDGLIDDVRLSAKALDRGEILLNAGSNVSECVARWNFEETPGPLADASGKGHDLLIGISRNPVDRISHEALVDLCHVLLNSSGFLYRD